MKEMIRERLPTSPLGLVMVSCHETALLNLLLVFSSFDLQIPSSLLYLNLKTGDDAPQTEGTVVTETKV